MITTCVYFVLYILLITLVNAVGLCVSFEVG